MAVAPKPLFVGITAHKGPRKHSRHARRGIDRARRVEDEDRQLGVVLRGEGPQRLVEPLAGIARDDHGHDRRSDMGLHQGQEATRRSRSAPQASQVPRGTWSATAPAKCLQLLALTLYNS